MNLNTRSPPEHDVAKALNLRYHVLSKRGLVEEGIGGNTQILSVQCQTFRKMTRKSGRRHNAIEDLRQIIVRWAQRKYKRLRGHAKRAWGWLRGVKSRQPNLFAHWSTESPVGAIGAG